MKILECENFFYRFEETAEPSLPERGTNPPEPHMGNIVVGREWGLCTRDGNSHVTNKLIWLEGFALYRQGRFCPVLCLGGKRGSSLFRVFPSQLWPWNCPPGVGVASPLEVIFFSSPSGGPFPGTLVPPPPDYNIPLIPFCTLLLNRVSLLCPNTVKKLIMHNELGHQ